MIIGEKTIRFQRDQVNQNRHSKRSRGKSQPKSKRGNIKKKRRDRGKGYLCEAALNPFGNSNA